MKDISESDYNKFEVYIASNKINNFEDDYINIIKDNKEFINERIE